jgi:dihydrofolate synthase/folylpolyglutamate synthase
MIEIPFWPNFIGEKPIDLNLHRVTDLLERLGSPEKQLKNVIHIAGTNGKGSTLAFMQAMLEEGGYSVNSYTSPHLVYFNERINIHGAPIDDKFLNIVLAECKEVCEREPLIPITFFEGTTIAAMLAFSRKPADFTLLETGMGGRLDATNVIEKPLATIITPISLDHQAYLGDSLPEIAFEKAGIIKEGVPVFVAKQEAEILAIIKDIARVKSAPFFVEGKDFVGKKNAGGFAYKEENLMLDLPLPNLHGEHQIHNAALAIKVVRNIVQVADISWDNALRGVKWSARIEHLQSGKLVDLLPDNFELWLDGGHNIAGAKTLQNWLQSSPKKTYVIFTMMRDKDAAAFLEIIKEEVTELYGVQAQSNDNSLKADEVQKIAEKVGIIAHCAGDIKATILAIIAKEKSAARILVCGSLYLSGEVLKGSQA